MDGRTLEKRYDEVLRETQFLRDRCRHLEQELNACRPALYRAEQRIDRLEQRNAGLAAENQRLKQKLADLTAQLKQKPRSGGAPGFVKANIPDRPASGKPGRKKGHVAALRPMPEKIDVHETVAVPIDDFGKCCCPECRTQLSDVEHHERYVEELVPSEVITTCYHTTSGWCPHCRKQVESRGENQPPAA